MSPAKTDTTEIYTFITSQQLVLPKFDNLIIIRSNYNSKLYSYNLFELLEITCPEPIKQAVPKRQAEYLAGRYCVQRAQEKLGINTNQITSGRHRNPVWPSDISGSITHTSTTAYAAIGYSSDYCHIGIDYEDILPKPTAINLFPSIISEEERERLLTWPMNFEHALTLTFSAKESLFKALYPHVGRYFDFSDAELLGLCEPENRFSIRLLHPLAPGLPKGMCFDGYYQFSEKSVLTIIAKKRK